MSSTRQPGLNKIGKPPGTLIYTGTQDSFDPTISVLMYSPTDMYAHQGRTLEECCIRKLENAVTWINIEGLHDVSIIEQLANKYALHPLTTEDILNVNKRPKMEEFENYIFVALKKTEWNTSKNDFITKDFSLIIGKDFVLSFQDEKSTLFDKLRERICNNPTQALRKQTSDYLAYRLIDLIIDQYFLVLEHLGEQMEKVENLIISNPTKQSARTLYRLKHHVMMLHKLIWSIREVIGNLLKEENNIISPFTHIYLRDIYDHVSQIIDNVETFREMISNMLDIYLSSLTYRMNDIMKLLTIIMTSFIPASFIASIYGMNFKYMPELAWKWSYPVVLIIMLSIMVMMLWYYRYKKWW